MSAVLSDLADAMIVTLWLIFLARYARGERLHVEWRKP